MSDQTSTRRTRADKPTIRIPYRTVAESMDRAAAVAAVMREADSAGVRLSDDDIDG